MIRDVFFLFLTGGTWSFFSLAFPLAGTLTRGELVFGMIPSVRGAFDLEGRPWRFALRRPPVTNVGTTYDSFLASKGGDRVEHREKPARRVVGNATYIYGNGLKPASPKPHPPPHPHETHQQDGTKQRRELQR